MSILEDYENKVKIEKCYIPENDEGLKKLGVEVCAKTFYEDFEIHNRIIFRKGDKESDIECIHTAVCNLRPNPETETGFEIVSLENRPDLAKTLSFGDQFFAINSFTQALVENGIQQTLINALERKDETGKDPLDMNDFMRNQIIRALMDIAPEETKEISLLTLKYISAGDPKRLKIFSEEFGEIICKYYNSKDIIKLNEIDGGLVSLPAEIKKCIIEKNNLSRDVIDILAKDPDSDILNLIITRRGAISEKAIRNVLEYGSYGSKLTLTKRQTIPKDIILEYITSDDLFDKRIGASYLSHRLDYKDIEGIPLWAINKLAMDDDEEVRRYIASIDNLPTDIYQRLSDDKNSIIRSLVAIRQGLPDQLIKKFAIDPSEDVRRMIANRVHKPVDVVLKLAKDKDAKVRESITDWIIYVINGMQVKEVMDTITERDIKHLKDILRVLAEDINRGVLMSIISNNYTPENIRSIARKTLGSLPPSFETVQLDDKTKKYLSALFE